jgi:uroporphyrinogen-III synthase
MSSATRILSTKVLSQIQKDRIVDFGCNYVERNFIETEAISFNYTENKHTLLFSSQNAVRSVFINQNCKMILRDKKCYCVGEKTKKLLSKNGQKVTHYEENSSKLADFIVKNARNEQFLFFCGKERRGDLEDQLNGHKIQIKPLEVYQTFLKPKAVGTFDIVLFYSPSGVRSFLQNNSLKQTTSICIGTTTAEALKNNSNKIIIASNPTVEHMIFQIKKQLQHHD